MMLLAIIFLVSGFLLGYLLCRRFLGFLSDVETIAAGIAVGLTFSSLLAFLISFASGSLTFLSISISILLMLLASFILFESEKKKHKFSFSSKSVFSLFGNVFSLAGIILLFLFLSFFYFDFLSFNYDGSGNITSIANSWGDYPFHISIINSFTLRNNFPPAYPILSGAQMRYPFLFDFFSAVLVKGGFPLQLSILLPNFLAFFSLLLLAYFFAKRILQNSLWASVAVLLFFLNGNLSFLQLFSNSFKSLTAYSFIPSANFQLSNLVFSVFLPQRTALLGFAISLLIYSILYRFFTQKTSKLEMLFAGFLLSLLPLIHTPSFISVSIVSAGVFAISFFIFPRSRFKNSIPLLAFFFLPVLLLALPQVLWILQQQKAPDFFGFQNGWTNSASSVSNFALFWFNNGWLLLVLGIVGFLLSKKEQRLFCLPFLLIFAIANLFRFQPWAWDNLKYIMHWMFFTAILASFALWKISENVSKILGRTTSVFLVSLFVFLSVFSALLASAYWGGSSAVLFSSDEQAVANEVIRVTSSSPSSQNALFLTAPEHNHLVLTLAGRQIFAGYDGHLWSHGLLYSDKRDAELKMLKDADYSLMKSYGINYVFIGPAERKLGADDKPFLSDLRFKKVLERQLPSGKYLLFEVS